jgi:SAM-dependent methyltransferase
MHRPSEAEFRAAVCGDGIENSWALGRSPHLHRIFNIFNTVSGLAGPTLDIGSGGGSFFRAIKGFRPDLLPYSCADIQGEDIVIDSCVVPVHAFECERDRLPLESKELGLVLLCDVLEHLLVDPMWTILEINRVLKMGGHFVLSTPNVASIDRVTRILQGEHPGTEHHFKPTNIADRHNREWTFAEVYGAVTGVGFRLVAWDSNHQSISESDRIMLEAFRRAGLVDSEDAFFGPDLVFVFEKTEHLTLDCDLCPDRRWPVFLYTGHEHYRRRPEKFPVLFR